MSRVGKMPVVIPNGVTVDVTAGQVCASGPKGKLSVPLHPVVSVAKEGTLLNVSVSGTGRSERALHGLYRALLNNAVTGVHSGFEKRLELNGVGYQVQLKGKKLELSVGYSKPVIFDVPSNITVSLPDNTHLVVSGVDKQAVGQFAAQVRASRVPDPYKAKGVKYAGEFIRRKAGKAFGAGAK
ncbi:MAG: 50S ribosomal protein L6 [Planctomycetes bacterium]|nr:50S ribosomal protein L6 [Planctomycetota bacterium]